MKIYANTNNSTLEFLKQFMGTDVWVKCRNVYHNEQYLYIVSIDNAADMVYYYKVIGLTLMDEYYNRYAPRQIKCQIRTGSFDTHWVSVCEPLSVLTTEEINDKSNNLI